MPRKNANTVIAADQIEQSVYFIRGHRVMLDSDLAVLYQVETFNLNKAVKRNIERFPDDFMFQLSKQEWTGLTFQTGISSLKTIKNHNSSKNWGGVRKLPYAFTEQGIAMLSTVLRSKRAVAVNIEIMRAFVKMRKLMNSQALIKRDVDLLKHQIKGHDDQIKVIFTMMDEIVSKPPVVPKKRNIGFVRNLEEE